jgi:hypothetical protein
MDYQQQTGKMVLDANGNTLVHHLKDRWLELVNLSASCVEENVVVGALARFDLTNLEDKLMSVNDSNDAVQLEHLTSYVRHLLAYYNALLRSQKRRADDATHGG